MTQTTHGRRREKVKEKGGGGIERNRSAATATRGRLRAATDGDGAETSGVDALGTQLAKVREPLKQHRLDRRRLASQRGRVNETPFTPCGAVALPRASAAVSPYHSSSPQISPYLAPLRSTGRGVRSPPRR
mmetsp:Transcript_26297/g.76382  ORF Transcript_26297/g.76382 Transcript_26297/m.76382 type:complete len:131 (-) Transcript_26297:526-918(-)